MTMIVMDFSIISTTIQDSLAAPQLRADNGCRRCYPWLEKKGMLTRYDRPLRRSR